jgi:hypothetical protein
VRVGRRRISLLAAAAFLIALVVGSWLVAPATSLHVSRVRLVVQPPHEIAYGLEREVSDAALVRAIQASIDGMPRVDESRYFCPLSVGISYRLDFARPGPHLLVMAEPHGCRWVRLPLGDVRRTSPAFWELLAKAVGVPPADLFPDPLIEGTR